MRGIIFLICAALLLGCVGMAPQEDGGQVTFPGQPKEVHVPAETGPTEAQPEAEEPAEEVSPLEALSQEEFSYRTQDAWEIHGTLYHARNERPSTMIILLHMLGSTRADYDEVVVPLHEALPDADILALDMRGHGESINKRTWEEFVEVDFRTIKKDVLGCFEEFEVLRPSVEKYYLVGASIGSSVALTSAVEDGRIKKVVMLSPGMNYHGIDISDAGSRYQRGLYIAAGKDDEYSYSSAEELYEMSPSDSKVLRIYTGTDAHGVELFETEDLLDDMIDWLGN